MEYIRCVFRQFLDCFVTGPDEHEQCIPVLLKFLEFDMEEQAQILRRRQEMRRAAKASFMSGVMPSLRNNFGSDAGSAMNSVVSSSKKMMADAMQGQNPFRAWFRP